MTCGTLEREVCTTKMLASGYLGRVAGVENQRQHARALSILLIAAPEWMLEHTAPRAGLRRVSRTPARWAGECALGRKRS